LPLDPPAAGIHASCPLLRLLLSPFDSFSAHETNHGLTCMLLGRFLNGEQSWIFTLRRLGRGECDRTFSREGAAVSAGTIAITTLCIIPRYWRVLRRVLESAHSECFVCCWVVGNLCSEKPHDPQYLLSPCKRRAMKTDSFSSSSFARTSKEENAQQHRRPSSERHPKGKGPRLLRRAHNRPWSWQRGPLHLTHSTTCLSLHKHLRIPNDLPSTVPTTQPQQHD
jgi:hypothetical protein